MRPKGAYSIRFVDRPPIYQSYDTYPYPKAPRRLPTADLNQGVRPGLRTMVYSDAPKHAQGGKGLSPIYLNWQAHCQTNTHFLGLGFIMLSIFLALHNCTLPIALELPSSPLNSVAGMRVPHVIDMVRLVPVSRVS